MNLLDVGGRVEGLEPLLEKFFGPDGAMPEEKVAEALQAFRFKRDTTDDIYKAADEDSPKGSAFLRVSL